MRIVALSLVMLLGSASSALASSGESTISLPPRAPSAIYVDGVKIGAELPQRPKHAAVRTGRCSGSGCTIVVTY